MADNNSSCWYIRLTEILGLKCISTINGTFLSTERRFIETGRTTEDGGYGRGDSGFTPRTGPLDASYDSLLRIEMPRESCLEGYADDVATLVADGTIDEAQIKLNRVMRLFNNSVLSHYLA